MTPQIQEDIKTIASRIRRLGAGKEGMLTYIHFWDDLNTLLNLIIEAEVNIGIEIKTIAKRLKRIANTTDPVVIPGVFWDDLVKLLDLILEEKESE
ncbi:MAG: hypothetical protein FJX70_07610 [Alphaproteobacteria bacterium]|nr:hypothetical protein [Alphaproteobacteria bacterium]